MSGTSSATIIVLARFTAARRDTLCAITNSRRRLSAAAELWRAAYRSAAHLVPFAEDFTYDTSTGELRAAFGEDVYGQATLDALSSTIRDADDGILRRCDIEESSYRIEKQFCGNSDYRLADFFHVVGESDLWSSRASSYPHSEAIFPQETSPSPIHARSLAQSKSASSAPFLYDTHSECASLSYPTPDPTPRAHSVSTLQPMASITATRLFTNAIMSISPTPFSSNQSKRRAHTANANSEHTPLHSSKRRRVPDVSSAYVASSSGSSLSSASSTTSLPGTPADSDDSDPFVVHEPRDMLVVQKPCDDFYLPPDLGGELRDEAWRKRIVRARNRVAHLEVEVERLRAVVQGLVGGNAELHAERVGLVAAIEELRQHRERVSM